MRHWIALLLLAPAEDLKVEALQEAAPTEVAEPLRKELAGDALRISKDGKPWLDLWLRATVPTKPAEDQLAVKYPSIQVGTFVGALRVHGGAGDYKGQKIPAGVFTLRYAVQPEDGDHQGTSDTKDYAVLCPPAADATLDPVGADPLVKLSAKVTGKKHPVALWMPRKAPGEKSPRLHHDELAERWTLECETSQTGAKALRLWIVVAGKGGEQ
jgi:hypothetical protein